MGTKANPGNYDCYKNAAPDEPMFILLARDEDAADAVRDWARRKAKRGCDPGKIHEAMICARDMDEWREVNSDGKTA